MTIQSRQRFQQLSARYRAEWDAYQVIAHRNLDIVRDGGVPTRQELLEERQAAKAVEIARENLLGAITDIGN